MSADHDPGKELSRYARAGLAGLVAASGFEVVRAFEEFAAPPLGKNVLLVARRRAVMMVA